MPSFQCTDLYIIDPLQNCEHSSLVLETSSNVNLMDQENTSLYSVQCNAENQKPANKMAGVILATTKYQKPQGNAKY